MEYDVHPILTDLQKRYPDLEPTIASIQASYELLSATYRHGGKLLICGNGGSAADSDHIVGELMKAFERSRPIDDELRQRLQQLDPDTGAYLADHLQGALPAISLSSHTALMTAISNDIAGDLIFAQQVLGYGKKGDCLIAISASGNSTNILHALRVARVVGLKTIGFTGKSGGAMCELCDVAICVPYERTSAIQERHLPIYHVLSAMLEQEFFG